MSTNSYEKKARKKDLLGFIPDTGDPKQAAIDTGKDLLIGAIGGGLAGAILGRSSLLVGIAVTGISHYLKLKAGASFGIGMMASGGYQTISSVNGTSQNGFEGVKERMQAFKEDLKQKLFLDKILKTKKADEAVEGMGDVQYFTYPGGKELEGNAALDQIEQQIAASAEAFDAQQVSGDEDMIGEIDDSNLIGDVDDANLIGDLDAIDENLL
jgi:hypothetical protein